jgi:hypothetical protein
MEDSMKFVCLVYFDETSFVGFTEEDDRRLRDATIVEDQALRDAGKLIYATPLEDPAKTVTVTRRRGKLLRTDGPYAESKEWLGGFMIIEAADMEEAVAIAGEGEIPKLARIEVRPVLVQTHSETGAGRPELLEG